MRIHAQQATIWILVAVFLAVFVLLVNMLQEMILMPSVL